MDFTSDEPWATNLAVKLCDQHLRDYYQNEEFRAWLDSQPRVQDILFRKNIHWLVKDENFRARVVGDGAFAIKWLDFLNES